MKVILLAGGVFISSKVNKMPLVLTFLGAYFLSFTITAFVSNPLAVVEIFRTPDIEAALYFAFIILTDPPTSPAKYPDQIVYGLIVAAVSYAFFELTGVVYYLLAGVLVGNVWEAWPQHAPYATSHKLFPRTQSDRRPPPVIFTETGSTSGQQKDSDRHYVRHLCVALRFVRGSSPLLIGAPQSITVSAVVDPATQSSDPARQFFLTDELPDGKPGAPLPPIPGLPVESASGGIKAPQYFAPGVAGDHGEPIAQYLQIGGALIANNLSANAHGNGYSDPNFLIGSVLESVEVDSGAFNVREGNHAVNAAAAWSLRSRLQPFVTVTAGPHDAGLAAGWSPFRPETRAWLAFETAWGNGLLDQPEHRRQYKLNGYRVIERGARQFTVFGAAYTAVEHPRPRPDRFSPRHHRPPSARPNPHHRTGCHR